MVKIENFRERKKLLKLIFEANGKTMTESVKFKGKYHNL